MHVDNTFTCILFTEHGKGSFTKLLETRSIRQRSMLVYGCLCLSYIKPHLFKTKPLFYHTGKTKSLSLCPITNRNTLRGQVIYTVTCSSTEKWALCYRDFDHHDTDTNMLVERSV